MRYIVTLVSLCVLVPILFLILFTPEPCEHEEMARMYVFPASFSEQGSTRQFCRECDEYFQYALFEGTLKDQSYLNAIKEHSDGDEIIPGEYYTVTATVHLGFYGHGSKSLWLKCQVENEDFLVRFTVEFREEFRELVESAEADQEITFRGRFYDEGCGFTDCELIG